MSMTFVASKLVETTFEWVFRSEELDPGSYGEDDTFTPNPAYRPELNVNLSNANAADVLRALGYTVEDGTFDAPIDEFLARARQWLRKNIDAPSAAIPPAVDPAHPVFIDLGRRAGYLNETIHRLVVMAAEGKNRGATHISAA